MYSDKYKLLLQCDAVMASRRSVVAGLLREELVSGEQSKIGIKRQSLKRPKSAGLLRSSAAFEKRRQKKKKKEVFKQKRQRPKSAHVRSVKSINELHVLSKRLTTSIIQGRSEVSRTKRELFQAIQRSRTQVANQKEYRKREKQGTKDRRVNRKTLKKGSEKSRLAFWRKTNDDEDSPPRRLLTLKELKYATPWSKPQKKRQRGRTISRTDSMRSTIEAKVSNSPKLTTGKGKGMNKSKSMSAIPKSPKAISSKNKKITTKPKQKGSSSLSSSTKHHRSGTMVDSDETFFLTNSTSRSTNVPETDYDDGTSSMGGGSETRMEGGSSGGEGIRHDNVINGEEKGSQQVEHLREKLTSTLEGELVKLNSLDATKLFETKTIGSLMSEWQAEHNLRTMLDTSRFTSSVTSTADSTVNKMVSSVRGQKKFDNYWDRTMKEQRFARARMQKKLMEKSKMENLWASVIDRQAKPSLQFLKSYTGTLQKRWSLLIVLLGSRLTVLEKALQADRIRRQKEKEYNEKLEKACHLLQRWYRQQWGFRKGGSTTQRRYHRFSKLVKPRVWAVKIKLRVRRRVMLANRLRQFMQDFGTSAQYFRYISIVFKNKIVRAQTIVRSFLKCQRARIYVLGRKFDRILDEMQQEEVKRIQVEEECKAQARLERQKHLLMMRTTTTSVSNSNKALNNDSLSASLLNRRLRRLGRRKPWKMNDSGSADMSSEYNQHIIASSIIDLEEKRKKLRSLHQAVYSRHGAHLEKNAKDNSIVKENYDSDAMAGRKSSMRKSVSVGSFFLTQIGEEKKKKSRKKKRYNLNPGVPKASLSQTLEKAVPKYCTLDSAARFRVLHHTMKNLRLEHVKQCIEFDKQPNNVNSSDVKNLLHSKTNFIERSDIASWEERISEQKKKAAKDRLFFPMLTMASKDTLAITITKIWNLNKKQNK
eukprot:g687.t1